MKMGPIIDRLYELRAEKAELEAKKKTISLEMEALEEALFTRLDNEETIKAAGKNAGVTITTLTVPNVTDWDAVHQYIIDNDACYLLEKRVAAAPWRELMAMGTQIPGTEPFEKRSLSLRKL